MWCRFDPPYPYRQEARSDADPRMRASDEERNEVAERLSRHFAEGRLDETEFHERLGRAMGSTTRGDLAGLFDDLPRLTTDPAVPEPRRRRLRPLLGVVAVVLLAVWVTGVTASAVHFPWLLVIVATLLFWRLGGRRAHVRDRGPGTRW